MLNCPEGLEYGSDYHALMLKHVNRLHKQSDVRIAGRSEHGKVIGVGFCVKVAYRVCKSVLFCMLLPRNFS